MLFSVGSYWALTVCGVIPHSDRSVGRPILAISKS
ncbi:Uncharacterised protein [Mycobacteroides abscessus subsp. abscessus]|nr:Uncharacterised protein [Mycobacteroides abscessus subsp. abscessus]SKV49517.1 Uncharacterised protein [Mycobacteroides abscessus subsp. abscessus]